MLASGDTLNIKPRPSSVRLVLTTELALALAPYGLSSSSLGADNASNSVHTTMAASKSITPSHPHQIWNSSQPNQDHHLLAADVWCKGRSEQAAYADTASRCRRYFRCYEGKRLVFLCPGKLVFNGQRCVYAINYSCPAAPEPTKPETTSPQKPRDCEARPDGYHVDPESGCRSYFFCSSGLKSTYVCPGKTVFDGTRCVDQTSYKCPYTSSDCHGLATGYYPDYSSGCQRYYYCSEGNKLITLTCSDGRLFNGKRCTDPSQYRCPQTAHPAEETAATSPVVSEHFSFFTVQRNAAPVPISQVQPAYIVNGRVNSRSSATTTAAPVELNARTDCENTHGFFVIKGTRCQRYYFCIGGSRTDLSCQEGSVFNGQVCVDSSQYGCPETPVASDRMDQVPEDEAEESKQCAGKPDGVYVDLKSGCRSYFLCSQGTVTTFTCPPNQLFDGRRCAESRKVLCDNEAVSESRNTVVASQCTGRTSGLYSDKTSTDCRGYVYCRMGRVWASAQCGSSERFNDQLSRCVPAYEVNCPDITESVRGQEASFEDSSIQNTETNSEAVVTTTADDLIVTHTQVTE